MKLILAAVSFLILCTAASAQTPPVAQESAKAACKTAVEKICPGVQPGGGRIKACLEAHNTSIKEVCPGMGKHHGQHGQGAGNTATTPAPMAQPPAGQ